MVACTCTRGSDLSESIEEEDNPIDIMGKVDKEYGEDDLDGLVPPSSARSPLEFEEDDDYNEYDASFAPPPPRKNDKSRGGGKSLLFYVATVQAFVIIYRTEVFLGCALAASVAVAITTSLRAKARVRGGGGSNPFEAARIEHDYTSITSKYDLTLGYIDHWCLHGDDNTCRCDDPLEPSSRRSNPKWEGQHKENCKVAQAAVVASLSNPYGDFGGGGYPGGQYLDDNWLEGGDDDWVFGEGSRFANDDYGKMPMDYIEEGGRDDRDDGYAVPMPLGDGEGGDGGGNSGGRPANDTGTGGARVRRRGSAAVGDDAYELDVVFVGDSITEQRQGTSMGKPNDDYTGIKEVFDKTFTKKKGGEFNGVAMGISGDTVRAACFLSSGLSSSLEYLIENITSWIFSRCDI